MCPYSHVILLCCSIYVCAWYRTVPLTKGRIWDSLYFVWGLGIWIMYLRGHLSKLCGIRFTFILPFSLDIYHLEYLS